MNKLVCNVFGPPNSGKTVAATSLFNKLKKRHVDVVLVSEFAHEKVVEGNRHALANQLFIFGSQQYRIYCGYQHAQVVVTDSPILLASVYNRRETDTLHRVMLEEHWKYNNLNIVMELDPSFPYSMVGRVHSLTESISLGNEIVELLETNYIPHMYYSDTTEEDIVELVITALT